MQKNISFDNSCSVNCCVQDPADLEAHVEYLCSGSSLALCLQGENAVRRLQDVLGQEDSSSLWTYQGMAHSYSGIYGQCPVLHCILVHIQQMCYTNKLALPNCLFIIGSGSYRKAVQDVKMLFPEGLCCTETSTMRQEQVCMYRVTHRTFSTWGALLTDRRQTFCVCASCFRYSAFAQTL